eukprot:UN1008
MRTSLFVTPHPLDGVSAENVGLKVGKGFFDLIEQQLEYKESGWRVKANVGGSRLFNLKMKVGTKTPGCARNNIQFGTDLSNFGSNNKDSKYSIGGMANFSVAGVLASARLKVFSDEAVEVFANADAAGVKLGCDMRATFAGSYCGFLGASYGLPASFPVLKNVHVGSVLSLPDLRKSFGLFAEVPAPVEKAVFGVELFDSPRALLLGTELVLDAENSICAKADDNGTAHVSFIKRFKGIELRMAVETSFFDMSVGRFGAQVTLKQ